MKEGEQWWWRRRRRSEYGGSRGCETIGDRHGVQETEGSKGVVESEDLGDGRARL